MNFSPLTFINAKSKRCILSSCLLRLCNSLFELAPRGFVPESECKSTATLPNYQIFQQLFLNFFQHSHYKIPSSALLHNYLHQQKFFTSFYSIHEEFYKIPRPLPVFARAFCFSRQPHFLKTFEEKASPNPIAKNIMIPLQRNATVLFNNKYGNSQLGKAIVAGEYIHLYIDYPVYITRLRSAEKA